MIEALIVRNPDQSTEGADPRVVPIANLNAAGHFPKPILKVIREKCLDCCAGAESEVRKCTAVKCALWPYRMRKNPFTKAPGRGAHFRRSRPKTP